MTDEIRDDCGDTLLEAPDDPELRRFIDQRAAERRAKRRPAAWEIEPPTDKQLAYLRFLGHRIVVKTKGEAAAIISELVGSKK